MPLQTDGSLILRFLGCCKFFGDVARIGRRWGKLYEIYWEAGTIIRPFRQFMIVTTALTVAEGLKIFNEVRATSGKRSDMIGD